MARYIDIDKFKDYRFDCNIQNINRGCDRNCVECYYNNGGIEDVAPVVHSSWRTLCGYSKCNNCGQRAKVQTKYCPNCNAKMDKE